MNKEDEVKCGEEVAPGLQDKTGEQNISLRAEKAWAAAAGAAGRNLPPGNFNSISLKRSACEAAGPVLGTEDKAMNKTHRS